MSVLKVIEILTSSEKGWEDATQKAVTHASKTVKNIRSVMLMNRVQLLKTTKL